MDTDVSEKHTVSIVRVEANMLLRKVGIYKSTQRHIQKTNADVCTSFRASNDYNFYISVLENKIKARQKLYSDLMEQIRRREDFLDRMAEEEQVLEKKFCKIAQAELEKESAARKGIRVRITTHLITFLRTHAKLLH